MVFTLDTSKEIEQIIEGKEENNNVETAENFETIKEKIEPESLNVDLKNIKEPEPKKTVISINDESYLDDYLEKNPIDNKEEIEVDIEKDITENKSISELRSGYIQEENDTIDQFDLEDFEMASDFAIEALEVGTSSLFRLYAMDTSDANYEMTEKKKKKLKKLLTKILIRYSIKFPLGYLFVITIILTHAQPFMNAKENRKKMLVLKSKKVKRIAAKDKTSETSNLSQTGTGKPGRPAKPRGGQHK